MCLEKPKRLIMYQNSNGESIKVWKIMSSVRSLFGQGIYKCMFALPRNLVVCFYAELVRAGAGTGTSSFIMLFGKGWFRIRRIYIEIWLGRGVYYLSGVLNIFPRVDLVTSLQSLQVVKLLKSDDMNKNRLWD